MDESQLPFVRKKFKDSPVNDDYHNVIRFSGDPGYVNRLLIATPTLGTIRYEWAACRWGQMIPPNWSAVFLTQFMGGYATLGYTVADAQNLIVQNLLNLNIEWLLLIEDDVLLPPDAFIRFGQYITEQSHPIVSGLYYTKSNPCEPLVYRGRGTGPFYDWKFHDKVYVDGVPTGVLLIHAGILRAMWDDAKEYRIPYGNQQVTREVFVQPSRIAYDPETGTVNTINGTTDLEWCSSVIEGDYIRKTGWTEYWDELEDKKYPLLLDTNIFCKHIDPNGNQYPPINPDVIQGDKNGKA